MKVETNGLCIISDQYFSDFPNVRHMSNKYESRPYYLAVHEEDGIIWVIPLSSKVEKYRAKILEDEKKHGTSVFHYITRMKGKDCVFLIGNVIPVTEDYILRPFTVGTTPFVIRDKKDVKQITSRLKRYLAMVRNGRLSPAVDIMSIEAGLRKILCKSTPL